VTIPSFAEYRDHLLRHNPPLIGGLSKGSPGRVLVSNAAGTDFGALVAACPGASWRPLERVWEVVPTPEAAQELLDLADLFGAHVSPITLHKLRNLLAGGQF
jgi:hypothetical protein